MPWLACKVQIYFPDIPGPGLWPTTGNVLSIIQCVFSHPIVPTILKDLFEPENTNPVFAKTNGENDEKELQWGQPLMIDMLPTDNG